MKDKSQAKKLTWEEVFEQLSLIPTDNFTCDFFDAGRAYLPTEKKEELNEYKYNDMYPYLSDF